MKTIQLRAFFITIIIIMLNSSCSYCDDEDNKTNDEKNLGLIAADSVKVENWN